MPFTTKSDAAAVEVTVSLAVRSIVVEDVVAPEVIVGNVTSTFVYDSSAPVGTRLVSAFAARSSMF